jgi:hypothetical protein
MYGGVAGEGGRPLPLCRLWVGDTKKTNACDAQHLLKLLLEDSFY